MRYGRFIQRSGGKGGGKRESVHCLDLIGPDAGTNLGTIFFLYVGLFYARLQVKFYNDNLYTDLDARKIPFTEVIN